MKKAFITIWRQIKGLFGFCQQDGCWKRSVSEVSLSTDDFKQRVNLCEKHIKKFIDEL